MIIKEQITNDLVKTYSDKNLMIQSKEDGAIYQEAIDLIAFNKEYLETDIPIQVDEEGEENEH